MPNQQKTAVVELTEVSKSYLYDASGWSRLRRWLGVGFAPQKQTAVLKPLSLRIEQGEIVGIVGRNGSGKSTLLKLIVGTLTPTTGSVLTNGRITALLELGLGFNPEFTGRDNVSNYLALNGFSEEHIKSLMPAAEKFAEIGAYFGQAMRTYSSGMQMRVAFAAATAVRPDILIVDEALAVGDSYFVHKCIERIRNFCALGTTLLYVSHDMNSVRTLCTRAILLDAGELLGDDAPAKICDFYNGLLAKKEEQSAIEQVVRSDSWIETRSGSHKAKISSVSLVDAQSHLPTKMVKLQQWIRVEIEIDLHAPIERLVVGVMLKDRWGHLVWGSNTWHADKVLKDFPHGCKKLFCSLKIQCCLGAGSYGITVAIHEDDQHTTNNFDWIDNAIVFDVERSESETFFIGSTFLPNKFDVEFKGNGEKL